MRDETRQKSGKGIASMMMVRIPKEQANKVFDCCLVRDMICQTTGSMAAHMSYTSGPRPPSEEATKFIIEKLQTKGASGGASGKASSSPGESTGADSESGKKSGGLGSGSLGSPAGIGAGGGSSGLSGGLGGLGKGLGGVGKGLGGMGM